MPFGNVGANVGYAMIAKRYLHEHEATPEQLAKIAVHQRDNACRNPDAWFYGQPITVDDVLNSPMVADPLHLLEIVMPSAGAAALVVVHPDLVAARRRTAAWLLGAGECVTHKTITYAPSLTDTAIRPAADRAFAQAGVDPSAGRAGVAVRLLHDHRAGDAGGGRLLRRGEGGALRRRARPALERRLPAEHPRRPAQLQPARARRRDEPRHRGRPPGAAARR